MVKVEREICCMSPPQIRTDTTYICDLCGRECIQTGARHERLYQYGEDQLCWECLHDAMFSEGVYEIAE